MEKKILKECDLTAVSITGGLWKKYQDLLVEHMVPYQLNILTQPGGSLDTVREAAGETVEDTGAKRKGTDLGKLLEAASYSYMLRPDPALKEKLDALVDLLCRAQLEDGYLNPFLTAHRKEDRLQSLLMSHELYSMGHLMEGMLMWHKASGNEQALKSAERMGDCLHLHFGHGEGQIPGYDGHPEVEMALYRLYTYTGKKEYLETVRFFVEERGQESPEHPHFYDYEQERNIRLYGKPVLGTIADWADRHRPYWGHYEYFLADKPAREQKEPHGHAVRAMYFYCAMADLAAETGDAGLYEACQSLFHEIETNNMYLNGSIGQDDFWEGIGKAYDLPSDYAYSETCASVGLILFAQRMLKMDPSAHYADIAEQALYNTVLAGTALDGEHYFYCNPLEVWPYSLYRYNKRHIEVSRYSWTEVACCPPNVARLLGEAAQFAYMYEGDSVWVNQYMTCEGDFPLEAGSVHISQVCDSYPWKGNIRFTIGQDASFTLRLRIPGWCTDSGEVPVLTVNGQAQEISTEKGYAVIFRSWKAGDTVQWDLPIVCRRVYPNPRAYHLANQVAVARGPLVYCAEEADNGALLSRILLPEDALLQERWESDLLEGVYTITAQGVRTSLKQEKLYTSRQPDLEPVTIKWIPYFLWANRTPGEMRVFFQEKRK